MRNRSNLPDAQHPLGRLTVTRYATPSQRRNLVLRYSQLSKLSPAVDLPPSEPSSQRSTQSRKSTSVWQEPLTYRHPDTGGEGSAFSFTVPRARGNLPDEIRECKDWEERIRPGVPQQVRPRRMRFAQGQVRRLPESGIHPVRRCGGGRPPHRPARHGRLSSSR